MILAQTSRNIKRGWVSVWSHKQSKIAPTSNGRYNNILKVKHGLQTKIEKNKNKTLHKCTKKHFLDYTATFETVSNCKYVLLDQQVFIVVLL